MDDTHIKVDENRVSALKAAVSAGGAASVQAAVESAVDAWLAERALAVLPDDVLRTLWRGGVESGDAGAIDFDALKAEARRIVGAP